MGVIRPRTSAARLRDDAGVSLIEIMVALSLLIVLSSLIAAGLLNIQKSALRSKERSAAANLATREIELVRNWFHSADTAPALVMAAGDTTNANPLPGQTGALVVDNVPYTVKRSVEWLVTGSGMSACDGGSVVSYPSIGVHVEVTWPNMGAIPAVVSDTVLTPPKSVLNASSAYIAVKVLDRDGMPNESRLVTASGPGGTSTDTTGPDGCATFVLSTPGTYTVSVGETGYVAYNGSLTQSVTVAAGSLGVKSFSYDLGETLRVALTPPSGFSLPTTLPAVTIGNSGIQPSGVASYASTAGGTTVLGPLWPFASGYSVWAGSCAGSDPALEGARPAALTPAKGSTTNTTALLQGLAITTTRKGVPVNVPVTAITPDPLQPWPPTGSVVPATCPSGDATLSLGTSASGVLNSSVPYGNWVIQATINGQQVSQAVTVTPTSAVAITLNGTV